MKMMKRIKEVVKNIKEHKSLVVKQDNQELCKWVDKLSAFIVREHFNMVCKNDRELKQRQKEVIKSICLGEKRS